MRTRKNAGFRQTEVANLRENWIFSGVIKPKKKQFTILQYTTLH